MPANYLFDSRKAKWIAGNYCEEALNEAKTKIMLASYPLLYHPESGHPYTFPEYPEAAASTAADDAIGAVGLNTSKMERNLTLPVENVAMTLPFPVFHT